VPIVLKSGSLNLLEPSGPVQACNGVALPLNTCDPISHIKIPWIHPVKHNFFSVVTSPSGHLAYSPHPNLSINSLARISVTGDGSVMDKLDCFNHRYSNSDDTEAMLTTDGARVSAKLIVSWKEQLFHLGNELLLVDGCHKLVSLWGLVTGSDSGFGGLEVACWPLVPGRSRRIFREKNSSARLPSEGK
jgi:hypothetical protein